MGLQLIIHKGLDNGLLIKWRIQKIFCIFIEERLLLVKKKVGVGWVMKRPTLMYPPSPLLPRFFSHKATSIKVRAAAAESLAAVAAFPPQLDGVKVEDLVAEYLSAQSLEILPENELTDTVILSVEKQEKDLIQKWV